MKRPLMTLALLMSAFVAFAQYTPMQKYEIAPAQMEEAFIDYISPFPAMLLRVSTGQYVGQVNPYDRQLYGYGRFINNSGEEMIGKFRNGVMFFGVTIGKENAKVGSTDFYASYSLSTGQLEYILQRNQRLLLDTEKLSDYTFMSQTYTNGDRYIGEMYKGKRHGYGILYYANGNTWMGQWVNDVRSGYGAFFTTSNSLLIGHWEGDDQRRLVAPNAKKK